MVISRVGQDAAGDELRRLLADAGADTSHLQSDPDLPTGRVIVRALGDTVARYLETRTAFDNLQWDYDLEDIAQQADAVEYSMLTRRSGQTRSEENRFLAACAGAIKVFDLTYGGGGDLDRRLAQSGLEYADIVVVNRAVLSAVMPGTNGQPIEEAVASLQRQVDASAVIGVEHEDSRRRWTLHRDRERFDATTPGDGAMADVAPLVAILHGVLRGKPFDETMQLASRVAGHVAERPDDPLPEEWL